MKKLFGILTITALLGFAILAAAEAEDGGSESASFAPSAGTPAAAPAGGTATAATVGVPSGDSACIGDPAAIEDLKHRREELEARAKALDSRENELKARERAADEQLAKIQQLRDDVAKIDGARKKENDEKVAKLVETFQTMSPKAASAVLASLDETLAVASMARMDTQRLAKIMNVMEPAKSARLTEILAGVVRARNIASGSAHGATASNGAAATIPSTKGGEKNDGQN